MVQQSPRVDLICLSLLGFVLSVPTLASAQQTQESVASEEILDASEQQSLDELEQALRSRNWNQRYDALVAIGAGDDQLERRISSLADALTSSDRSMQSIGRLSIQRMGDKAKPTLQKFLDSEDSFDSIRACGVVSALASQGDEFADEVIEILKDGDLTQRRAALFALKNLSPAAIVDSMELVTKELDAADFNTQCQACAVLRQIGPEAKSATPRLVKLLNEGNVSSRTRAAQALAAIGPVDGYDIPELLSLIHI